MEPTALPAASDAGDRSFSRRSCASAKIIVGAEIDAVDRARAAAVAPAIAREAEIRLPCARAEIASWVFGHFDGWLDGRRKPRSRNSRSSSSRSGFGVVSSFSPTKMEFAPARKHSAAASRVSDRRPALRRTMEAGISKRAVAIVRARVRGSAGSASPSGVPGTLTSMLMGTLSGCGSRVAS